jgi:hypothetical protein
MRTNVKIKNLLTYLLFVTIIGCQDNNVISKRKSNFIETIKVEDDKELQKMINDLNKGTASSSGRTLNTNFGEVKFDEAVKLNDTIYKRTRYSLWINKKTDSLIFENLVIVKRKEGVFQYILQYLPDPVWYKQNYKTTDWSTFTGKVRQLTLERKFTIEFFMKDGAKFGNYVKGGRTQECCRVKLGISTATGLPYSRSLGPYLDIDCPSGFSATLWTRVSDCGGGGDPVGGGASGPSSGGGGSSGGNGSQDTGGGGGTGSGNSNSNSYTNPIGIYTPRPGQQHGIAGDEPWPGSDLDYPYLWWQNEAWLDAHFSLDVDDVYSRLTVAEKILIASYPDIAYTMSLNKEIAEQETIKQFGRNGLNDKSDAFRHCYFQAINTNVVGSEMTKLFSDAHESETPIQLALEKEMDLFNNQVGIDISKINNRNATSLQIMDALLNGRLKYLTPLDFNQSPRFDANRDGVQDCPTCLNGMISGTKLTFTNN